MLMLMLMRCESIKRIIGDAKFGIERIIAKKGRTRALSSWRVSQLHWRVHFSSAIVTTIVAAVASLIIVIVVESIYQ